MKISVDAGALCVPQNKQFGTYVITKNILEAIGRYDNENAYTAYTYEKLPINIPHHPNIVHKILRPPFAWMSVRVSLEELLRPKQIYLGLSQAVPWYTKAKVVTLLHGLSFYFHKELYPDSYEALKDQVLFAISRSDVVVVSTERVKKEIYEQFGYNKCVVIPFGVPFDILESKKNITKLKIPYFMFVGMNHPIKNMQFIINAFKIFKEHISRRDYELILVGDHQNLEDKELKIRSVNPKREELADLYRGATGYITSSHYESFNMPVLEALASGCSVIGKSSAIIPEFRPYVAIADEMEEFVTAMIQSSSKKSPQPNKSIIEHFGWGAFTKKLISQYSV